MYNFYTVQIPKLHGLLTQSYTLRQLTPKDSPGTRSTVSKGCTRTEELSEGNKPCDFCPPIPTVHLN